MAPRRLERDLDLFTFLPLPVVCDRSLLLAILRPDFLDVTLDGEEHTIRQFAPGDIDLDRFLRRLGA